MAGASLVRVSTDVLATDLATCMDAFQTLERLPGAPGGYVWALSAFTSSVVSFVVLPGSKRLEVLVRCADLYEIVAARRLARSHLMTIEHHSA